MARPLHQAKAEFFRTLGHPARIRVLELLSERDHAVHELLEAIEIEPSNLSQQLAVLRRAGLVDPATGGGGGRLRGRRLPRSATCCWPPGRSSLQLLADQDQLRRSCVAPGGAGDEPARLLASSAAGPDRRARARCTRHRMP